MALAQTPAPLVCSLGYSTFQLRPHAGSDQRLNGFALGGHYRLSPAWSLEGVYNRQTGTEATSINLRQSGILVGPRYTVALGTRWEGSVHLLAGLEQLQADQGDVNAKTSCFAYGPGLAVDFRINSHLTLRGQEDLVLTHYAGVNQRSPCFFLGLVYR